MAGEDNNGTQWNYYIGPSESAARRSWQPLAPMPPTTGRNHRCRICTRSFDRPSSLVQHMFTHTGERPHLCSYCRIKRFATTSNLYRHMRSCPRNPRKGETNLSAFTAIGEDSPPVNRHESGGSVEREQGGRDIPTPQPQRARRASPYSSPDGSLDHRGLDLTINPPYNPTPASILLETRQLATEFHGARRDPQGGRILPNTSTSSHRAEPFYVAPERPGELLRRSSVHNNLYNTYNVLEEGPPQSHAYTEHDETAFSAHRIAEHSSSGPGTRHEDDHPYVTSTQRLSDVHDHTSASPHSVYPSTTDVARETMGYLRGKGPGNPAFWPRDDQNTL